MKIKPYRLFRFLLCMHRKLYTFAANLLYMNRLILLTTCLTLSLIGSGFELNPGFSKAEYIETLKMNAAQGDSIHPDALFKPDHFSRFYRSRVSGLQNRFDLWKHETHNLVGISMRGTSPTAESWLGNFYSAMIPAQGTITINDSTTFNYKLAENPKAAIHIGWTIGLGALSEQLVRQIDSCIQAGATQFLIFGHSQGGALSYLTYSYLRYLQKDGKLPADVRFKMYASAGPKPGNLFYAYDFEQVSLGGWAYNVVNPEDWVPQTPITVQTSEDFSETNPFVHAPGMIKSQKFPVRLVLSSVYKGMDKATKKARKKLLRNLGYRAGKQVKKMKPHYQQPDFLNTEHYTRAGNFVVLTPNSTYYSKFPQNAGTDIFTHHMFEPYLMLALELPE